MQQKKTHYFVYYEICDDESSTSRGKIFLLQEVMSFKENVIEIGPLFTYLNKHHHSSHLPLTNIHSFYLSA